MAKNKHFRDDIIIANDDGYMYHFTQDDLKLEDENGNPKFRVNKESADYDDKYGEIVHLLARGTILAAVPDPDKDRVDVTIAPVVCYLVNLDALKKHNGFEPG